MHSIEFTPTVNELLKCILYIYLTVNMIKLCFNVSYHRRAFERMSLGIVGIPVVLLPEWVTAKDLFQYIIKTFVEFFDDSLNTKFEIGKQINDKQI